MKTLAIVVFSFLAGLFAPNPHFTKLIVKWINTPVIGGFDPLALALTALVFTGIYFARAKRIKGGKA